MQNCYKTIHNSVLNVYQGSETIATKVTGFWVSSCPKICLTQRICRNIEDPFMAKIILCIFNYESYPIKNIRLIHSVIPNSNGCQIIKSTNKCYQNHNTVLIDFPCIMPLNVETVEVEALVSGCGEYSSKAQLVKNLPDKENHVLQNTVCSWVIE